jgi:hypothetical protein
LRSNERSVGVLNRAQYSSDIITLVVLWQLRYKLSLRESSPSAAWITNHWQSFAFVADAK